MQPMYGLGKTSTAKYKIRLAGQLVLRFPSKCLARGRTKKRKYISLKMRFKYCGTPVRVRNGKVYCKAPSLKEYLTMSLESSKMSVWDDQHINPLNVFIYDLQKTTGITDLEYEKGDVDDEENGIIH